MARRASASIRTRRALILILAGAAAPASAVGTGNAGTAVASPARMSAAFEPNLGQIDAAAAYLARGRRHSLFLTPGEVVLALDRAHPGTTSRSPDAPPAVVRMRFLDAGLAPAIDGVDPQPGVSNYFIGNDPGQWRRAIPHYARVEYHGLYPGVDLVFHGDEGTLEYDWVVAPGADPGAIRLGFDGVAGLHVDGAGNLVLALEGSGELVHRAPVAYHETAGCHTPVRARFVPRGDCEVGFAVDGRDPGLTLVIDPVLAWSTYLGASGQGGGRDLAYGIAIDGAGNAYVTGETDAFDFPTAGPYQAAPAGGRDVFVAKLDPTGATLLYSTYLGGGGDEGDSDLWRDAPSAAIAVDGTGYAYVTGATDSTDFPTVNAFQAAFGGGAHDAFVFQLDPTGSTLVHSTYLGGTRQDVGYGISVAGGSARVAGATASTDFPVAGALQPVKSGSFDIFVTRLDPSGSSLVFSTYIGGGEWDFGLAIAVDAAGSTHVAGRTESPDFPTVNPVQAARAGPDDAYALKLTPDGSGLVYSTYLGGSSIEAATAIAADSTGAYLAGITYSTDFPTAGPVQAGIAGLSDSFVTKLSPLGSLAYSTYIGGSNYDRAEDIAVDGTGSAHVAGQTLSTDFPTAAPLQGTLAGTADAFVTSLDPAGSTLVYSTYLGGSAFDGGFGIALDASSGSVHVVGDTGSEDFPTARPIQPAYGGGVSDAFVARLDPAGAGLIYSTYLGGGGGLEPDDFGNAIAVDGTGSVLVTGFTYSTRFPTAGALQPAFGGGSEDAFVTRFDPSGSTLVFSTYLGGSGNDEGYTIAVDAAGRAHLVGSTSSTDFPTVRPLQAANAGGSDAFVATLEADGAMLAFATYLGGSRDDQGYGLALDGAGLTCLAGWTSSIDFPTVNALQSRYGGGIADAFVTRLDEARPSIIYSTYLGGAANDWGWLAADAAGNAFVTGATSSTDFPTVNPLQPAFAGGMWDAFVAKIDPPGSTLLYSTYLGGAADDRGNAIAVDASGVAHVAGVTDSLDFPVIRPLQGQSAGAADAFVARLDPAGSTLVSSTYLGGGGIDAAWGIAVGAAGSVYLAGETSSADFPTLSPIQPSYGGSADAFVTELGPGAASFVHSTYLGGSDFDLAWGVAADGGGNIYVAGDTISTDFPTRGGIRSTGAGDFDAFVARIEMCQRLPGRVVGLAGIKILPADARFSWDLEADAAGGYRLYAVGAKPLVPTANVSRAPVCVAAALELECTHAGALDAPPGTWFYRVTGVCPDALSEGPL